MGAELETGQWGLLAFRWSPGEPARGCGSESGLAGPSHTFLTLSAQHAQEMDAGRSFSSGSALRDRRVHWQEPHITMICLFLLLPDIFNLKKSLKPWDGRGQSRHRGKIGNVI